MRIYTSYFGLSRRIRKEHPDFAQIAICGKLVFPWDGLTYQVLAPRKWFFDEWKTGHDDAKYVERFNDEVLGKLDRDHVLADLGRLAGGDDKTAVLMCYEKPGDFCHRHLVAKWLGDVEELQLEPAQETLDL